MNNTSKFLQSFRTLSQIEQYAMLQKLNSEFNAKGGLLQLTKVEAGIKGCCPLCNSENIHKRGAIKGVKKYKCNTCLKWFNENTGTALWDIKKKEKWQSYIDCLIKGYSIRKCAAEVGICIQTSFDWRHKIISILFASEPESLSGRIECDELEMSLSQKGDKNLTRSPRKRSNDFKRNTKTKDITTVQVMSAIDTSNNTYFKAIETKRVNAKQISKSVGQKISKNSTLITDKHPSYKPFAKSRKTITHHTILAKEHVDKRNKTINLQKINNQHKQLRQFLDKFNGVSSKYLQNYLNWYAYGEKLDNSETPTKKWFEEILKNTNSYNAYKDLCKNLINIRT